jgi:hypothetical protein
MKMKVLILVVLFALASFVIAEDPETPKPLLKKGDVMKFIKTFPLLKKDFDKFGVKHEAKEGSVTYPEALKASAEFRGILKKHGWDEHFFEKTMVIAMGYAGIVYKKGIAEADPKMQKAIKEIKSNTALSDEMKKQLIQSMQAAKGAIKQQSMEFSKRIHKADIELIKPHIEELKKVMEDN